MSLLRKNTVASLTQKSANAISVFQKTVSDLATVNETIESEVNARQSKINDLRDEQLELSAVAETNQRFIKKLNEFLGIQE